MVQDVSRSIKIANGSSPVMNKTRRLYPATVMPENFGTAETNIYALEPQSEKYRYGSASARRQSANPLSEVDIGTTIA